MVLLLRVKIAEVLCVMLNKTLWFIRPLVMIITKMEEKLTWIVEVPPVMPAQRVMMVFETKMNLMLIVVDWFVMHVQTLEIGQVITHILGMVTFSLYEDGQLLWITDDVPVKNYFVN